MNILFNNSYSHGFVNSKNNSIKISLVAQNNKLLIDYRDNGVGIEPLNIEKIFLPFYSTKHLQGNVGLGLNVAKKVISAKLGGEIHYIDTEQGVHFKIILPC